MQGFNHGSDPERPRPVTYSLLYSDFADVIGKGSPSI